jgi:EAL domain-containing protein (putative c-di-GMP-specific phosphodiesterase class I)/ActR/RegA family two-component response regulator
LFDDASSLLCFREAKPDPLREMTHVESNIRESHQIVLILDDDLMITEGLAAGLARPSRTIVTCNDLETGEMVVEWLRPSHVVSDIRLTGMFGYEGLDFIRFVKKHSPDSRIVLMTGDAPDALQLEASERGAVGFLRKPFEISELDSVLDMLAPRRTGSPEWPAVIRVPTLEQVLASDRLFTVFQPIVKLGTGAHIGYEALTRYPCDNPLKDPEVLFQYAGRKQRLNDLEVECIGRSLLAGAALASSAPLFLNVHPEVFSSGARLRDAVLSNADRSGVSLSRIVLEITEQASLNSDRRVFDTIEHLKTVGVRFAFDDVGIAYSHLPFIDKVRPAFLKISQHFGTGFETDDTKTKIVRNLISLASDFDCELILEGIETAPTAKAAIDLGISLGQGYHFARPADAGSFLQ